MRHTQSKPKQPYQTIREKLFSFTLQTGGKYWEHLRVYLRKDRPFYIRSWQNDVGLWELHRSDSSQRPSLMVRTKLRFSSHTREWISATHTDSTCHHGSESIVSRHSIFVCWNEMQNLNSTSALSQPSPSNYTVPLMGLVQPLRLLNSRFEFYLSNMHSNIDYNKTFSQLFFPSFIRNSLKYARNAREADRRKDYSYPFCWLIFCRISEFSLSPLCFALLKNTSFWSYRGTRISSSIPTTQLLNEIAHWSTLTSAIASACSSFKHELRSRRRLRRFCRS